MFAETGISGRVPFRIMFDSYDSLVEDINKYKTICDVYTSIYFFKEKEEKMNGKYGPNYDTAIINKVAIDLDFYEKTKFGNNEYESFTPKAQEDLLKLEEWADKKDLLREYRFSGGGFYFIFSSKGHPLKLRDFEINLQNELNIRIDISTIGDTSRMLRVTNSFNFKSLRKCFCIPLRKEELYFKIEDLKVLAKEPRLDDRFFYGRNTYDFSNCKIDEDKIKLKELKVDFNKIKNVDVEKLLAKYGWEIEDFCSTIKGILSLDHVGNALRYEVLKYLKTIVKANYEDAVKILVGLLNSEGIHSAVEGQAKYVYGYNKQFNPKWKLKSLGYCDSNCNFCEKYKNLVWDVLK